MEFALGSPVYMALTYTLLTELHTVEVTCTKMDYSGCKGIERWIDFVCVGIGIDFYHWQTAKRQNSGLVVIHLFTHVV